MGVLNKLKKSIESYHSTIETQTYWAAAVPPATSLTLKTRNRRVKYTTYKYKGGSYNASKAKADELETNPNITDISLNEYDELDTFAVTATLKETGIWGAWY